MYRKLKFYILSLMFAQFFVLSANAKSIDNKKYEAVQKNVQERNQTVLDEKTYAKKIEMLSALINFVNMQYDQKSNSLGEANAKGETNSTLEATNNAWTYVKLNLTMFASLFVDNHTDVYNCENIKFKLKLFVPKKSDDKDWSNFTNDIFNELSKLADNLCSAREKTIANQ